MCLFSLHKLLLPSLLSRANSSPESQVKSKIHKLHNPYQMDSSEINNIKVQKADATLWKLANVFRIIEICVLLVMVCQFSTQLPLAVRNSGRFPTHDSCRKNPGNDYYEEFVGKSKKTENSCRYEVEYRMIKSECREKVVSVDAHTSCKRKNCRSQSEKFRSLNCNKSCRELRRSGTEKHKRSNFSGERGLKNSSPVDNKSNEEFQQMIEAFIARHHKFRIKEEHSVI